MNLIDLIPIFKKEEAIFNADEFPSLANAYGHIMKVMQTTKSPQEKTNLILAIFKDAMEQSCGLYEQCIEELEKQNQILLGESGKFISRQEELEQEVSKLIHTIQNLAYEKGIIEQNNLSLQEKLEGIFQEKQSLEIRLSKLESENEILKQKINDGDREKQKIIEDKREISQKLEDLDEDYGKLIQENEEHKVNNQRIKERLDKIEASNEQLKIQKEEFEIQEAINKHLYSDRGAMMCLEGISVVALSAIFGPLGGIAFTGIGCGVANLAAEFDRLVIEREIKAQIIKNPNSSKKQIALKILQRREKERKKSHL